MHPEPSSPHYLAPDIELLGLTTARRVCSFCTALP